MAKFMTMEEIHDRLMQLEIPIGRLTEGIINQNTFSNWRSRGLPSSIVKYKKLLDRLDSFEAKNNICSEWAASNNHGDET